MNGLIEHVFAHGLSEVVGGELGGRWVISGCFVASGHRSVLWHRTLLLSCTWPLSLTAVYMPTPTTAIAESFELTTSCSDD